MELFIIILMITALGVGSVETLRADRTSPMIVSSEAEIPVTDQRAPVSPCVPTGGSLIQRDLTASLGQPRRDNEH